MRTKIKEKPKGENMTDYEYFKRKVYGKLRQYKHGLTWGEIKKKTGLQQTVPYKGWCRKLEKDIGLRRERDTRGTVWLLVKSW